MKKTNLVTAYQIKITLLETKPVVWRRLIILSNMDLENLSYALIGAMGWNHTHLHVFDIGDESYGPIDYDDFNPWEDEKKVRIRDFCEDYKTFNFTYDIGDNWTHKVVFEKEVQAEKNERYPKVIDGKNACPPEDCGGVYGFENFKTAMADSKHESHQEMRDWYGGDFIVNDFDPQWANARLMSRKIPKNISIKNLS